MRDSRTYVEATEQPWMAGVPMSHLSIEVGHFVLDTISGDSSYVEREFRRIVPLVAAFVESARIQFGNGARVSTCYLLDDYFQSETDAAAVITELLGAARRAGLGIDYLARESGCVRSSPFAHGVPVSEPIPVAEMVAARIVAEPAPSDTGSRPPTAESGWLCNGRRSSEGESAQAMRERTYRPPEEFGRREHSIFMDVEMWSTTMVDGRATTRWSSPFLAAVWQLMRLGMLRYHGAPVVNPYLWRTGEPWPKRWHEVPPVVQLVPTAAPFAAYQTLSMLPKRYLSIEHAVRVILDHLDLDDDVMDEVVRRGAEDEVPVTVSRTVSERLAHLLLDGS
ncbi:SCO2522 family protein [Nocardia sp. NPDC003482]